MGLIGEFKEFAVKGNALDMAVGIILGAAFNKVVNSLVADIIMPPIGIAVGNKEFKHLAVVLKEGSPAVTDPATGALISPEVPEAAIRYGLFINNIVDFLIVAMSVFFVVKMMNRLIRERGAAA